MKITVGGIPSTAGYFVLKPPHRSGRKHYQDSISEMVHQSPNALCGLGGILQFIDRLNMKSGAKMLVD
jgi:hypothetical protein